MRTGLYPPELKSTNLDFDWSYRVLIPKILNKVLANLKFSNKSLQSLVTRILTIVTNNLNKYHGPSGLLARTSSLGGSVTMIVSLLAVLVIIFYFET